MPISLSFVRSLALVRQSASCEYRPHVGAFQPQFPRRVAGQQPLSQVPSLIISRRSVRTPSLSNGVTPALSADADALQWSASPAELFTQRIQQKGRFTVNRATRYPPTRWPKSPVATSLAKMTGASWWRVYAVTGAIKYGEHSRPNPLWRLQIAHRTTNGVGVISSISPFSSAITQLESE